MKTNLLIVFLFFLLHTLKAQDTIRTLIISEARIDNQHEAYVELTNIGTTTLDLSEFEFGKIDPWTNPYKPGNGNWFMLPKKMLAPGKSFVIAKISDWVTKMWAKSPDLYARYGSKPEFIKLADLQIHVTESPATVPQSIDSISSYAPVVNIWNGSYCWYIRHHVAPGDSVVVDQVGGIFDDFDGTSKDVMHDVAGYPGATGKTVLIRKSVIKKGNIDFNISNGTNADESEWMVVPFLKGSFEPERAVFWTVGNYGDYHLNSLTSSSIDINWNDSVLTVPWGIRNDDSIIYQFKRVPGIAWHYDYSKNHNDSAYVSVRAGDKLTVYACGNKLEKIVFKISALPSTSSDNKVIPLKIPKNGFYKDAVAYCEVTDNAPGIDTIRGIPFACRKDSLLKYLEKPAKATLEFTWVDGVERADLKKGDILTVTAENGSQKKYYIKPNRYFPSHQASISSITWPDIPASLKGKMGWKGDTIPDFLPTKFTYQIRVPWDYNGIPALIGKQAQVNAQLQVTRAANLEGNVSGQTITFTCTAEDDTTIKTYTVELIKEWTCCSQQWKGEPFISEYVFKLGYNDNFCEIVNPGTKPMDLSNYMITFGYYNNATEAITQVSGSADYKFRYNKYIPGYKWVDSTTWLVKPAFLERDMWVNPAVQPNDVFVMASIFNKPSSYYYPKSLIPQIDIDFNHNPWGEDPSNMDQSMGQWWNQKVMLFKVLNDSIKQGLKPANDPNDFKLIDVMGTIAGDKWVVGGKPANMNTSWIRKSGIYKGPCHSGIIWYNFE